MPALYRDTGLTSVPEHQNVGPYGWTSNDLTTVKDLYQFVTSAQAFAKITEDNADYTNKALVYFKTTGDSIDDKLAEANTLLTNINTAITNLNAISGVIKTDKATVKAFYAATKVLYDKIHTAYPTIVPPSPQDPTDPQDP